MFFFYCIQISDLVHTFVKSRGRGECLCLIIPYYWLVVQLFKDNISSICVLSPMTAELVMKRNNSLPPVSIKEFLKVTEGALYADRTVFVSIVFGWGRK